MRNKVVWDLLFCAKDLLVAAIGRQSPRPACSLTAPGWCATSGGVARPARPTTPGRAKIAGVGTRGASLTLAAQASVQRGASGKIRALLVIRSIAHDQP
jgi:hypothetical protein